MVIFRGVCYTRRVRIKGSAMQERKVDKNIVASLAETMPTMNLVMVNNIAEMMPTKELLLLIIRLENDKIELEKNPNIPTVPATRIEQCAERIKDYAEKIKICREVYQRRMGLIMPDTEKIINLTWSISVYLYTNECVSPTNDLNPSEEALLQLINSTIRVMDGEDGFDKKDLHECFKDFSQDLFKLASTSTELDSSLRDAMFELSYELPKSCSLLIGQ
jgi:hypothetical protein